MLAKRQFESAVAIAGDDDFVTEVLQVQSDELCDVRLVFDEQYSFVPHAVRPFASL